MPPGKPEKLKKCHLANLKNYLKDMPPGGPEELLKKTSPDDQKNY